VRARVGTGHRVGQTPSFREMVLGLDRALTSQRLISDVGAMAHKRIEIVVRNPGFEVPKAHSGRLPFLNGKLTISKRSNDRMISIDNERGRV